MVGVVTILFTVFKGSNHISLTSCTTLTNLVCVMNVVPCLIKKGGSYSISAWVCFLLILWLTCLIIARFLLYTSYVLGRDPFS